MTNEKTPTVNLPLGIAAIVIIALAIFFATKIIAITVIVAIATGFVWFSKTDKTRHVFAGVGISIITGALAYTYSHLLPGEAALIGLLAGTIAGLVKELIWDGLLKKGTCSLWDFIATFFGSCLGALLLRVIYAVLLGEGA